MADRPLISVITACYNAVEFIEQCLQSVIGQRLPGIEHVVIDGGSTDGTVDVIKRYADKLSYWHSQRDNGIGHAFNIGVQHSHGEWLLFLNADDYFCRVDALDVLVNSALFSRADVVYGEVQPVTREAEPKPVSKAVGWPYLPWKFLLRDLIPHPAALTARAYFDRVGPFREDMRIAVDYEHYLREYRTLRTVFLPDVTTHMRIGGLSSDSAASLGEMFQAHTINHVLSPFSMALLRAFIRLKSVVGRTLRAVPGLFALIGRSISR